ncbi:hypothetical protein GCM10027447_27860 [Glycomyces halotolerans]
MHLGNLNWRGRSITVTVHTHPEKGTELVHLRDHSVPEPTLAVLETGVFTCNGALVGDEDKAELRHTLDAFLSDLPAEST